MASRADYPLIPEDRSFGELLGKLKDDSTDLVKTEVELAKRETKHQIEIVEKRVAAAAVAGAVAHIGAALLLFGFALVLALVMPLWASTLIVGVVACVAAALIAMRQKKALEELDPAPRRAAERVKQDFAAIKEAAR
jgi:VIT1/CCC1 family predicted Fe2+/Mn2+ transporter